MADESSGIEGYLKEHNREVILEGLNKIGIDHKEVIYMFYYEEMSIKDISKVLNKNENTIKTILRRVRAELSKIIEWEDVYA